MGLNDNFNWTNNFNDTETTDVISFLLDGDEASAQTELSVKDFDITDSDGLGHPNWDVGDKLTFAAETGTPVHTITEIDVNGAGTGTITVTPGLASGLSEDDPGLKQSSYKGKHGSAENHLRLFRQGLI